MKKVKHYSVDINLFGDIYVRKLEYKSLTKAKQVYNKCYKTMIYDGEDIDDIQLIKVFDNGDWENIED
jgi:hypothetical protein